MQVVHGELVADTQLVAHSPVADLVDGLALGPLFGGQPHQQPLAQRGAQGIHGVDFPLGIFLPQLLGSDGGGVIGGGQAGGEGQHQHVTSGLKLGLHGLKILLHVYGGGGGRLAIPQHLVKGVGGELVVVRIVVIGPVLNGKAQRQDLNIHLPHQVLPQVCRGVGEDGEIISLGHLWMHSFP